ncbi:MAG: hypothetical protein HOV87_02475, partial [Catenulispora sp.]|nr:hypothetical protein [Catenulispora sp.]
MAEFDSGRRPGPRPESAPGAHPRQPGSALPVPQQQPAPDQRSLFQPRIPAAGANQHPSFQPRIPGGQPSWQPNPARGNSPAPEHRAAAGPDPRGGPAGGPGGANQNPSFQPRPDAGPAQPSFQPRPANGRQGRHAQHGQPAQQGQPPAQPSFQPRPASGQAPYQPSSQPSWQPNPAARLAPQAPAAGPGPSQPTGNPRSVARRPDADTGSFDEPTGALPWTEPEVLGRSGADLRVPGRQPAPRRGADPERFGFREPARLSERAVGQNLVRRPATETAILPADGGSGDELPPSLRGGTGGRHR